MKRGLVFTATLAALTLGLVACGGNGGGTPVKDVTINNKDVLQADWYVEDADRNINMSIEGVRIAEAIDDGDLVVTSSDSTVFTVATSMQKIHAVGAGTATLTATYKNKKSDSVDIEVKVRPAMRVVTHIDTSRDDYFLRYKVDGVNYFATDEMSGFYIKPVLVDEKKEVKVQEDASPVGDYKYTITIGEKMIGAYSGTHKNIGFVGEKVEDDGAEHDLEKALFKFTDDYRFATNYFGSSDYYLAAYGGASTDRIAFQEDRGTYPASAFLKLVEYGEPVPATGVTLDKSELSIHAGAQEKLTATIAPADSTDEIVWSSSNEQIAKVSQGGVVTGVKESSTPVVITAAAGNFSATCTVTVLEALNYGTKDAPLTVEQAKKFLDDYYSDGSQTAQHMFVTGVVSDAGTGTRRNIWLQSSDGATAQFFESYSTICDEGIEFPEVGDTISVEGYAKIYGTTYELTSVKIGSSYDNPTIYNVKKGEKPALTGVSVSPKTSEVNLNGATAAKEVKLTAAPVPSNAELGTVTWECSDADVNVNNGVVSVPVNYVAEGAEAKTLTVTAKVGDFSDSATITVKNESSGGGTALPLADAGADFTGCTSSDKAMPDGCTWTYITNNPEYPNPSFNNGGFKFSFINQGLQSAELVSSDSITVTIKVGALNAKSSTTEPTDPTFTVYGLAADGSTLDTENSGVVSAAGNVVITLEASSMVGVKIMFTGFGWNGSKQCNVRVDTITLA